MRRIDQGDVPRDRWGRPLIDGKPYTRASTLAKALDDTSNLMQWKARKVAEGMGQAADLVALAATSRGDKKVLDDVVERAMDRAGAGGGRDIGTGIHAATEMLDGGEDITGLPTDLQKDALAYQDCYAGLGLTPVLAETFVVNRHLQSAGTFDRLMVDRDGDTLITDIKTVGEGKDAAYSARWSGLAWSIQLAVYAFASPWTAATGVVSWSGWDIQPPRVDKGIVWVIRRGQGTCEPVTVDLTVGLRAANMCADVRDIRKLRPAVVA